ncbi:unnamed protein product, partial [Symbiodinium microadriaticum]
EDDYRLVVDSEHDRTSTRLITAHSLPQLMGRFLMGIGIGLATRSYLSEVVLPEQRGGVFAFCLRLPCADGRVHCAGAAKVDVADKWIQPFVILLAVLEEISSLRRPGAEKCLETYPSGRGSLEELSKDADTADTAEGPCLGLEPAAAVLNQACASTSILIYAQKRNAQDLLTLTVGAKRMLLGVGGGLSTVALLILRCCLAKSRAAVDWHELLYCHLRQHLGIGYWIVACRGHCCGRAALCLGIAQSVSTATLFAAGWLTTLTFRDVISLGPAGLLIYVAVASTDVASFRSNRHPCTVLCLLAGLRQWMFMMLASNIQVLVKQAFVRRLSCFGDWLACASCWFVFGDSRDGPLPGFPVLVSDWPLPADAADAGLPVLVSDWPLPGDAADAGFLVSGHRLVFAICVPAVVTDWSCELMLMMLVRVLVIDGALPGDAAVADCPILVIDWPLRADADDVGSYFEDRLAFARRIINGSDADADGLLSPLLEDCPMKAGADDDILAPYTAGAVYRLVMLMVCVLSIMAYATIAMSGAEPHSKRCHQCYFDAGQIVRIGDDAPGNDRKAEIKSCRVDRGLAHQISANCQFYSRGDGLAQRMMDLAKARMVAGEIEEKGPEFPSFFLILPDSLPLFRKNTRPGVEEAELHASSEVAVQSHLGHSTWGC